MEMSGTLLARLTRLLCQCKGPSSEPKPANHLFDENIPATHARSSLNATHQGPLTRSRAKKLQEQVNSFLSDCNFHTSKNVILPKCSTLVVLRNIFEEEEETLLQNGDIRKVTRIKVWMFESDPMNVRTNV